ncbi:hypothetical protein [Lysobacter gummosus]|uniref:hypothetical protein n=1 Tax=Lysobacter gummosus TaxID=262324 RepID=UPI00363B7556
MADGIDAEPGFEQGRNLGVDPRRAFEVAMLPGGMNGGAGQAGQQRQRAERQPEADAGVRARPVRAGDSVAGRSGGGGHRSVVSRHMQH